MPTIRPFPLATKALAIAVTFILALSGHIPQGASYAASKSKISWSEKQVSVEVSPGGGRSEQVTFTSDQNLSNVTIEAVPEIAGLVRVQPSAIGSVSAGQPQTVTLFFSAPASAPLGLRDGTIHLRSGSRTIPQPLKVLIDVKEGVVVDESDPYAFFSPGVVTLSGASETAFNPRPSTLRFEVGGATLDADPARVHLFVNGLQAPATALQIAPNSVTVPVTLAEGRNDVSFFARDTLGRLLHKAATLWAGSRTLTVSVLDENGQPASGALVTARLGDDKDVSSTATSAGGLVTFANLPDWTLILEASATGNRIASVATNGGAVFVQLRLRAINAPSAIDNNDFSQGTAGWETGSAPVQIVPHNEGVFIPLQTSSAAQPSFETQSSLAAQSLDDSAATPSDAPEPAASRAERHAQLQTSAPPSTAQTLSATAGDVEALSALATGEGDNDLVLFTAGEGPQTISRTFRVEPGTVEVRVRYKFITSEVPGGYFGTKYNDYFNISLRTQGGGGAGSDSQTMNGLGLSAFSAGGATDWREFKLPVTQSGDVVQVDATVANVADGYLDSQLVLDVVAEPKVTLSDLKAVVKKGTAVVNVTMATDTPVTLTMTTKPETTGEAQFAATGSTTMIVTKSTQVEIKGLVESSKRDNIRLAAKDANGKELAHDDFCVLWVTLELRTSGTVSDDNAAKNNILLINGSLTLGTLFSTGPYNENKWRNTVEIRGTVWPSDFNREVMLKRTRLRSEYYVNDKLDIGRGPGPDNTDAMLLDLNPLPNGRVYDYDGPGYATPTGSPAGTTARQRVNFAEFAMYKEDGESGDGRRCSDNLLWFARISVVKTEGGEELLEDVPGDNMAGLGFTPYTWNLQP